MIASGIRNTVENTVSIATIVPESVSSVKLFAIRYDTAKTGAVISCAICPILIVSNPGRSIMTTPAIATSTLTTRLVLSFSLRKIAAPIVIHIGVIYPIAVTSAMGILAIAKNHSVTPIACTAPLAMNVFINFVLGGFLITLYIVGARMIIPNAYRMNADSPAGSSVPSALTSPVTATNAKVHIIIHRMPCIDGLGGCFGIIIFSFHHLR